MRNRHVSRRSLSYFAKLKRLLDLPPDPRFLLYNSPHPTHTDHTSILTYPETRVTTLPSGLRVATESNLTSSMATLGVWIDAGSRYEPAETNGTAYLLNRIIFKRIERRCARELEEVVESMGGQLNAWTTREHTSYSATVFKSDVPRAIDILADISQNFNVKDNVINIERDKILKEMVEGRSNEINFDHLHSIAYQHTPLGSTVSGPAHNIRRISKQHLQDYISTNYTAPRMIIAASGAVEHEDIVEEVDRLFYKLSTDPTTASKLTAEEPAIFTSSEDRIINDNALAHFAVAFKGASWTDPTSIALMVMQQMLGSWSKNTGGGKHMGSQLAQKIEIHEIAESMMAFNTNYKDTGLFGVYAIAKPDCLDGLAYFIMSEMTKLCYQVSEEDVCRARNQLKSGFLLYLDGSSTIAEDIGRQLLTYGRRIPMAELFSRIDAVNPKTVKRVAKRFIVDQDFAISAIGPIQKLPDYNWFRTIKSMRRF